MLALKCLFALLLLVVSTQQEDTVFYFVPHTHQDAGWTKTFDEYARARTRKSFKTFQDTKEKFLYQEMSFLWDAIENPANDNRAQLTPSVFDRMEIVGGGWVLTDEACPSYQDYIRNMEVGHRYARQKYAKEKRDLKIENTWNIDPFGHSRPISLDFAIDMGMKHVVINRISRDLKEEMRGNSGLQFNWCSREGRCILTHVLSDHYASPPGFHFDGDGSWDPFLGNDAMIEKLCKHFQEIKSFYKTRHVLVPYGDDFTHTSETPINHLVALKKYLESNRDKCPGTKIEISTLSDYFKAFDKEIEEKNIQLPKISEGDFYPYNQIAGSEYDYWTGYFTSHPTFKRQIRAASDHLRSAEIITSLHMIQGLVKKSYNTTSFQMVDNDLEEMNRQVALLQHHDGITGTSTEAVRKDYISTLTKATTDLNNKLSDSFSVLIGEKHGSKIEPLQEDSILSVSNDKVSPIIVMNNLGYQRSGFISLRLSTPNVEVVAWDERSKKRASVVQEIVKSVDGSYTLYFYASLVPSFGFQTYVIEKKAEVDIIVEKEETSETFKIENEFVKLHFLNESVSSIQLARPDTGSDDFSEKIPLNDKIFVYETKRNQGAYVFNADSEKSIEYNSRKATVVRGKHIHQVKIELVEARILSSKSPAYITYTLYKGVAPTIDQIPVDVQISVDLRNLYSNFDVGYRLNSTIQNQGTFFTDANGYDVMKRTFSEKRLIAGNYYPATESAWISDNSYSLALLLRESHGVSSLSEGALELSLARESTRDDGKGLGERIFSEHHPIKSRFQFMFLQGDINTDRSALAIPENKVRSLAKSFDHALRPFKVSQESSLQAYTSKHILSISPINNSNMEVHFLSFGPYLEQAGERTKYVLRLHNTNRLASVTSFDLESALQIDDAAIKDISEWTLSLLKKKDSPIDPKQITFSPNEIRTFIIEFQVRKAPAPTPTPVKPDDGERSSLLTLMGLALIAFGGLATAVLIIFIVLGYRNRKWFTRQPQQSWSLLNDFDDNSSEELQAFDESSERV